MESTVKDEVDEDSTAELETEDRAQEELAVVSDAVDEEELLGAKVEDDAGVEEERTEEEVGRNVEDSGGEELGRGEEEVTDEETERA